MSPLSWRLSEMLNVIDVSILSSQFLIRRVSFIIYKKISLSREAMLKLEMYH